MYSNIVATGAFAWAPSSGVPVGSGVDPGTSNADIVDDGLEEGSGDSEEDVNPDFQTDMAGMVGEINMSTSSNTKSSGKRKGRDHADSYGMTVFKRVVSICRSLFEALYYSTFDFKAYEHMHLR
ncbi:hypothetical protein POTOM_047034 [Populus tomentosa]|uniref:Uncharacterized protein n=1 Tax=Populus tomentosa TaxID=118781 RepID=A0A8X7YJ68_POPTO|nr:hypothetical protein POTOM_047034 [Populus tomentosa]